MEIRSLFGRHNIRNVIGDQGHLFTFYKSLTRPISVKATKSKVSKI